jgi:hypothetical protein
VQPICMPTEQWTESGAPKSCQVDREEHWDDYIILQLYVATAVHMLPWLYCWEGKCHAYRGFPTYHNKGLVQLLLIHAGKPPPIRHP